ncbi:MAG: DNA polymerase I [Bacteroidales bacterium]|jgi:DNA polymerase-1|nr:DNA polymerase I [Bacteroidales bacterium]NLM92966.1 DNA polymerase I [Bacteroidales bacterium]
MPTSPKKLFLLDAMALIYRAYYAFSKNPRINSKGMNTSAVLGFANTLTEVLKKENPTHIAVAFDSKAPTVRHAEFAAYKAQRLEVPEDIIASLPFIRQLVEGFNIPVITLDGYEADDIIGTLAKKAEQEGFLVYMMTPDKDFGQLVSENIYMYKPARMGNGAEIWGPREVCEKYGIERPEQVIDLLGLWGDASDNIPGVPGIGEKKAKNLIREFDSVENLLKNLDQVKEKRSKESLQEYAEQALLSKKLATIILDVPVAFDVEALRVKDPNPKALLPLFEELEFRTYAKRLFSDTELIPEEKARQAVAQTGQMDLFGGTGLFDDEASTEEKLENLMKEKDYRLLKEGKPLDDLLEQIRKEKHFCFDTETTGLDIIEAQLTGIAFCLKPGHALYLPFPEDQDKARVLAGKLKAVFEDQGIEKTGQNLKFDIAVLHNYNILTQGKLFDTMLAHYLLQPDMRHNMDLLAQSYLNYTPVNIEALIGPKGKGQLNMREVPIEKVTAYACEDADITLRLRKVFEPMLNEHQLLELFHTVETPLIPVLAEMERHGVSINEKALADYSKVLEKRITEVEQEIYELAGVRFNIGSPKQLGEILFVRLKVSETAKKTKTKQYSTSEDVLSKLADKHPIIRKILDYRSLTKLKSTYVDTLPKLINPKTGRIHTSYNQAVAATGRLSSNNPNLQNIPIRTEEGRLIREAFVPVNKEYTLLAADYSQIELRIIASLSKDEAMMEAFHKNLDIHTATAARVYELEINEVTREMRRNAKTVNFGIIYGISAFGLADRLNIPRQEAAQIIDQYFEKYPGIKRYMNETIEFAQTHEYVATIMGRRRYIKDINSGNAMQRGFAERNAINAPVQGSAADMIKLAMIDIQHEMKEKKMKSRMLMQVHDELVFEVHLDEVDAMKALVESGMKNAMKLEVPVVVEMNTGRNWLEAH